VETCAFAVALALVAGVLAAGVEVDAGELGVLEELPQPASASRAIARLSAESRRM
jgi:hypothetical protein